MLYRWDLRECEWVPTSKEEADAARLPAWAVAKSEDFGPVKFTGTVIVGRGDSAYIENGSVVSYSSCLGSLLSTITLALSQGLTCGEVRNISWEIN